MPVEKAELLIEGGNYRQAIVMLESKPPSASRFHLLGIANALMGDFPEAIAAYEQSLKLNWQPLTSINLSRALLKSGQIEQAIPPAIAAIESARGIDAVRARSHFARLCQVAGCEFEAQWHEGISLLKELPPSAERLRLTIEFARSAPDPSLAQDSLKYAASIASEPRESSLVSGSLASFYYRQGQYRHAIAQFQKAIATARLDSSLLFNWQHGLGLAYFALGRDKEAIDAYREAVAAGDRLDWRWLTGNETVYRELLELLLSNPNEAALEEAIGIFDRLRLVELENFLQRDCFLERGRESELMLAAIATPKNTYMLLWLPSGEKQLYDLEISPSQLASEIQRARLDLEDIVRLDWLRSSRTLYERLPAELRRTLREHSGEAIVFVPDRLFRAFPLGALYDGEEFLLQRHPIWVSLGITSAVVPEVKLGKASLFGLSEGLPEVVREVREIEAIVGGSVVLDEQFTRDRFAKGVSSARILHIATHATFSHARDSFLRLGDGEELFLEEFGQLLRDRNRPLELVVLSACDTAAGDDRAPLGLAQVAIESRATVVASLWPAADRPTADLMVDFYRSLDNGNAAAALREAQMRAIAKRTHPSQWANFIVVSPVSSSTSQ